jgi:hypothetical protein
MLFKFHPKEALTFRFIKHISAVQHLLPIFHRHFGYFFPSLALPPVATPYQIGSSPSFLINAICALAARYSPIYSDETYLENLGQGIKSPADSWMARAKADVGHRLAMATLELVETLLIISWFEFGADRDSVSKDDGCYGARNSGLLAMMTLLG